MTPKQVENYQQGINYTDPLLYQLLGSLIDYDDFSKPRGFKILSEEDKMSIEKQAGEMFSSILTDCFGWKLSILHMQEYQNGVVDMLLQLDEESKMEVMSLHS